MADPLWYYSLNTLKQQLLKELKEENKADKADNSNSVNKSNNVVSDEKDLTSKTNTTVTKLNPQKNNRVYQYMALAFCATTFLSLASLMVLATKTKYPNFLSFSSSEISAKEPTSINFSSSLISTSTVTSNNLYQQLDTAIDDFLSSHNREHLTKARSIADEIDSKYQDKYGVDLVKYYELVPNSIKSQLLSSRQMLTNLSNQPIGKNYQYRLEEAEKLRNLFISSGSVAEAYKTTVLIAKLNVKLSKYEKAKTVINDGLDFAKRKNYLMLQGYFLLWQAKRLVEISEFFLAERIFKETIVLGKHLNIKELFVSPSMTLAATYLKNDDNDQALKISQDILTNSKNCNIEHTISLLHIAGISAFNNKFTQLSRNYLDNAVQLSKDYQNTYLLAMSYTFLAVTLADSKEFDKAESFYLKAKTVATQIEEQPTRLETTSIILGYQAKAKLMAGNFEQAATLYQETISIMNKLGFKNHLETAQLEEGLATSLNKTGKTTEAQKHLMVAKNYQNFANESKQTANCLLSFIPSNCKNTQY